MVQSGAGGTCSISTAQGHGDNHAGMSGWVGWCIGMMQHQATNIHMIVATAATPCMVQVHGVRHDGEDFSVVTMIAALYDDVLQLQLCMQVNLQCSSIVAT